MAGCGPVFHCILFQTFVIDRQGLKMVNVLSFEKMLTVMVEYIVATKTECLFEAQKHGYNVQGHCCDFDVIASFLNLLLHCINIIF